MDLLIMFGIALISIVCGISIVCLIVGLIYLAVTIINCVKEKLNEH